MRRALLHGLTALVASALVLAAMAQTPPVTPDPTPIGKTPHQISIEFDIAGDLAIGDRQAGHAHDAQGGSGDDEAQADADASGGDDDDESGKRKSRGAPPESAPYFASYDATELSRMYSSFQSLSEPAPGQPVWDGHDLRQHPQPMSSTRTTAKVVELDHHRPQIDAHGNVIPVEPHTINSMRDHIVDKKEARADAKDLAEATGVAPPPVGSAATTAAAAAAAASVTPAAPKPGSIEAIREEASKIDLTKSLAERAAEVAKAASAAAAAEKAGVKVNAPAGAAGMALALSDAEKLRVAREVFKKQNENGVIKDLNHMNVLYYVSRNQPFGLFLLCDCPDDYDLAVAVDDLTPQLTAKGHTNRMLYLSVTPQIASHFNLWNVFALNAPAVGQGPLNLGANDILVGDSKSSNTKTVAVTFAESERNKYAAVTVAITNECCGDKFELRVEHLDANGFYVICERLQNKDAAGWGQQLVVRWAGEIDASHIDPTHSAAAQAAEEKRIPKVPAVVIDNIPMGSMNEKYVFSRGHTGPIETRALVSFFDDFIAQTLPLFVRSQSPPALAPGAERPTPQPGEVFSVYGSTFREHVLSSHKDVLVLVYSPFCGGSHAVMPVFEQTALALAKEPNVRLVKFDKTQNDFPIRGIKIVHYPTVLLFPAGDFASNDYQFFDFDDYNGSKTPHQREVPHSHYSVNTIVQFVHEKGLMSTGTGAHFHLNGPNASGRLHDRHPGDPAPAHDHDHDHDHGHDHAGHTH